MSEVSETQLVGLAQKGDLEAFNELVRRYEKLVFNVAARLLSDSASAEDVTQETFISAYNNIGKFRGGSLKSWFLRIASNGCYDYMRTPRYRREVSLDASVDDSHFDVPSSLESPESYVQRRELGREIQTGLATLPEDQRTVLVLIDLQEQSYDEVAQATGASLGTVKSRLSRARAKLRDHLMQKRELLPQKFRLTGEGL